MRGEKQNFSSSHLSRTTSFSESYNSPFRSTYQTTRKKSSSLKNLQCGLTENVSVSTQSEVLNATNKYSDSSSNRKPSAPMSRFHSMRKHSVGSAVLPSTNPAQFHVFHPRTPQSKPLSRSLPSEEWMSPRTFCLNITKPTHPLLQYPVMGRFSRSNSIPPFITHQEMEQQQDGQTDLISRGYVSPPLYLARNITRGNKESLLTASSLNTKGDNKREARIIIFYAEDGITWKTYLHDLFSQMTFNNRNYWEVR
ncbi:hypothetical protein SK128_004110 [Halocaridina rubra]|uniref:Uncharacterized protein n=1 Tax=Halocaridina rubra TaxID=373956 RepID=A0AAN8WZA8_HALRR